MAKRNINELPILSYKQAESESRKLKSCWSNESLLSLRVLIYCASLLEQLVEKNKKVKKPRKISAWQVFLGEQMRAGKSIKEAAELWKNR